MSSGWPSRPNGVASTISTPPRASSPSVMRVRKKLGASAFTRMPNRPYFTARSRVSAISAPLLALYPDAFTISGAKPTSPITDAMLMTFPYPRDFIAGRAARVTRKTPTTFVSNTCRQRSSGISSNGAPQLTPALFTRMSTPPNAVAAAPTSRSASPGTVTSHACARTSMPAAASSADASSSHCVRRATITIRAPASPSPRAISSPSPRDPPVTIATRCCSENSSGTRAMSSARGRHASRAGRGLLERFEVVVHQHRQLLGLERPFRMDREHLQVAAQIGRDQVTDQVRHAKTVLRAHAGPAAEVRLDERADVGRRPVLFRGPRHHETARQILHVAHGVVIAAREMILGRVRHDRVRDRDALHRPALGRRRGGQAAPRVKIHDQ